MTAMGPFTTPLVSRTKKSIIDGPYTIKSQTINDSTPTVYMMPMTLTIPMATMDTLTPL
jgi:hypothetical protein